MAQRDCIFNTEYEPMSTAWAETQSMFLEAIIDSIEWKRRYARDIDGNIYPFSLYKQKVQKLHKIAGEILLHIAAVVKFEQTVYTIPEEQLTPSFLLDLASKISLEYFDYSEPSFHILSIPHIYSRESSAYYHSYGMAELAVAQWKKHFYDTY